MDEGDLIDMGNSSITRQNGQELLPVQGTQLAVQFVSLELNLLSSYRRLSAYRCVMKPSFFCVCETPSYAGAKLCLSQAALMIYWCGLSCAPGWFIDLLLRNAARVYEVIQNVFERVLCRRLAKN